MNRSRRLRSAACAVAATAGLLAVSPAAQAAQAPTAQKNTTATIAAHAVKDSAASVFSCRKNPTLPWCS
ncbi:MULTISPECIES: hypothetical protein [unclassified Corynebacterium]|uniref:hypothetical protein n=1 Tax=unclassified Corynebacterium TaxID=2624378 RepID=UPI0029CA473C|nr:MULTISPECIES: hypothetical protein [unclassified Corynebacterium]WPF66118.1 hypothetical protein OLX12_11320 [Corynebacterium sp. 22KM0430]WPF68610.1 hypothetical protein OLW90_11315 [Corynebacterium sp. 21KM1197]